MISIRRTPVEQMLAAHQKSAPGLRTGGPEVVNIGPVIGLSEPVPLFWDGTEYRVPPISYRSGLHLQRLLIQWKEITERAAVTLPELRAQERWLDESLDLMWSLLDPQPLSNPFHDASPQEVGQLLGFFSALQTMSHGSTRFQTKAAGPFH